MDKTALVGLDIDEGRRFLDLLRQSGIPVSAALWQKEEIPGEWRLLLVTPIVDELGPRRAYRKLDQVLSQSAEQPAINLLDVSLFTPSASFAKSLRRVFKKVRNRHVARHPVGDHFLEEGFIYFVN